MAAFCARADVFKASAEESKIRNADRALIQSEASPDSCVEEAYNLSKSVLSKVGKKVRSVCRKIIN